MLDPAHISYQRERCGIFLGKAAKFVTVNYSTGEIREHIFYNGDDPSYEGIDPDHDSIDCAHLITNEDNDVVYLRNRGQDPASEYLINEEK